MTKLMAALRNFAKAAKKFYVKSSFQLNNICVTILRSTDYYKNVDSFQRTSNERHIAKIPAGTDDIGICHYQ